MESRNWKGIGEFVGMGAIVASLVFVGVQLKQDRDVALAESLQASEASFAGISAMIAEYADVWLKGRNNEELSEAESIVMRQLVSTLYRRSRNTAEMRRKLGTPGTATLRDLAIQLHENAGARRIWEAQTEKEIAYFKTMAPDDVWRRNYRDEVLAELAKLDGVKE